MKRIALALLLALPWAFTVHAGFMDSQGNYWFMSTVPFDAPYSTWAAMFNPTNGYPSGSVNWEGPRWASSAEVVEMFNEVAATAPSANINSEAAQIIQDFGYNESFVLGPGLGEVVNGFTRDDFTVFASIITVAGVVSYGNFPLVGGDSGQDPSIGAWLYDPNPGTVPEPFPLGLFLIGLGCLTFVVYRRLKTLT